MPRDPTLGGAHTPQETQPNINPSVYREFCIALLSVLYQIAKEGEKEDESSLHAR